MKRINPAIAFVLLSALALPSFAQFAKPDDAIKYRKSAMFLKQQNFARLAAMASGKVPFDAKVAAESAAVAEFISKLPWAAFGPGTESGATGAKPEIWKEAAKFKELSDKLQIEMTKLAAAAKAGDFEGVKAGVSATGKVCKGCHDSYKQD